MDICVVGAGIIGASVSYHLTRLGARVTVLDATRRPEGASGATFGWINANGKQPDHYFELNRAGMAAHAELARVLGDDSWLHVSGSLEWTDASAVDSLRARVKDHVQRGYPADMVDARQLRMLEPDLKPPDEAALFASEGWVDVGRLIKVLLSRAQENGAEIRRPVKAREIGRNQRAFVATDGPGENLSVDVVVNCTGADAAWLLEAAGPRIETAGPVGLNVITSPAGVRLNRVIRAPGVHFRPDTGGRLMIATPASDKALSEGAGSEDLAARNVEAAAKHVPGIAGLAVAEARIARRAIPPDGLPIVGRLPGSPWLYHLVTHSGVTLAPLLGRLAAEEIVNDAEHERLAPYRPARFAASLSS